MKLSGFKTVFILTVAAVFSGLFLSLSAQQPTDKSGQSAAAPAPQQSTATLSEQKQQEDQESDPLKRALTPQQRVERRTGRRPSPGVIVTACGFGAAAAVLSDSDRGASGAGCPGQCTSSWCRPQPVRARGRRRLPNYYQLRNI